MGPYYRPIVLPIVLLTMHTPFNLVYGLEAIVPIEYLVSSLRIVAFTDMDENSVVRERLA
jgi:hypothetical protein